MNIYRFITKTKCGKTDVVVQNADTLYEAREKFHKHNELTHTPMDLVPMDLVKIEFKLGDMWFNV